LEASALGSLIAACPAWKRRDRNRLRSGDVSRVSIEMSLKIFLAFTNLNSRSQVSRNVAANKTKNMSSKLHCALSHGVLIEMVHAICCLLMEIPGHASKHRISEKDHPL